jgi:uncharacterized membrane protein
MNKNKHDIISLIIIVATLVMLGIGALMLGSFSSDFGDSLQEIDEEVLEGNTYVNVSTDFIKNDSQQFSDNYFFWFLVITFIGIVMMGLFLEFEPSTMIIIFVIGIIVIAMAWLGGSIYTGFTEDLDDSSGMTKTNILLNTNYFPLFMLVCLIVMIVIMYNRKKPGEFT